MKSTIYVKTLKKATNTVFCVDNGQKTYFDSIFRVRVPYASGQNIKHSFIDKLVDELEIQRSPTTFTTKMDSSNKLKEGEAYGTCNPLDPDQLIGGWMKALETEENKNKKNGAGKKANKKSEDSEDNESTENSTNNESEKKEDTKVIKRRSPFSISAMSPLHPYLAWVEKTTGTFDRSSNGNNNIIVLDNAGKKLDPEKVDELIQNYSKNLTRKFIGDIKTVNGLFYTEMAIDLRKLFCVTINKTESEISEDVKQKLIESGWTECYTTEGKSLLAPKEYRERLIPAIAEAIVEYRGTTNQSRSFCSMETIALSISDNANKSAASIRAKISGENTAVPIIEEKREGINMFITPSAEAVIDTNSSDWDALDNAKKKLIELLKAFDYENQIKN